MTNADRSTTPARPTLSSARRGGEPGDRAPVLYLAADLIWATRIKSAADAAGILARPVRDLQMLADRRAGSRPAALIVDLEAGDSGIQLIRAAKEAGAGPPLHVLVFGPHVDEAGFRAAREAGADEAMARGAFAAKLDAVLARLAAL